MATRPKDADPGGADPGSGGGSDPTSAGGHHPLDRPTQRRWSRDGFGAQVGTWHAFEPGADGSMCGLVRGGVNLAEEGRHVRIEVPPPDDDVCGHCQKRAGLVRRRTYRSALREERERLRARIAEIDAELGD